MTKSWHFVAAAGRPSHKSHLRPLSAERCSGRYSCWECVRGLWGRNCLSYIYLFIFISLQVNINRGFHTNFRSKYSCVFLINFHFNRNVVKEKFVPKIESSTIPLMAVKSSLKKVFAWACWAVTHGSEPFLDDLIALAQDTVRFEWLNNLFHANHYSKCFLFQYLYIEIMCVFFRI
jgi:hypothetical protein